MMTDCKESAQTPPPRASWGFLVVGMGVRDAAGPGALPPLQAIAGRLAGCLGVSLLALPGGRSADGSLAALQASASQRPGGWMAPLTVDPGLTLAEGICWAQVLGAWRQPVVLVIPAGQLASGLAAAGTALLRQWGVPLVGLLQWEGAWNAADRRADGLPWLGRLSGEATPGAGSGPSDADGGSDRGSDREEEVSLAAALALRWRQLDRA